jgi:hypothetical protein
VASPKLEAQRERVFKAAFAEAEEKHGKLLETCDEGTKCRTTIINELKVEISAAWKQIIEEFKVNFVRATKETQTVVNESWEELKQCQIDKPCC